MANVDMCWRCASWPCKCSVTAAQNTILFSTIREPDPEAVARAREADAIVRELAEFDDDQDCVDCSNNDGRPCAWHAMVDRARAYAEERRR